MENEHSQGPESVYSTKVRAGKRRTYFFDVRKTKGDDFYITLTESTRKFTGQGYNRHKIFLYKEDFNRFLQGLEDVINHVKTVLNPEYDYEQFDRRQEEWERQRAEEAKLEASQSKESSTTGDIGEETESLDEDLEEESSIDTEEDIDW